MGCYAGDQTSAPQSVGKFEGRGQCPEEPAANGERLPQTFSDMPDAASTSSDAPQARSQQRQIAFRNQTIRVPKMVLSRSKIKQTAISCQETQMAARL